MDLEIGVSESVDSLETLESTAGECEDTLSLTKIKINVKRTVKPVT